MRTVKNKYEFHCFVIYSIENSYNCQRTSGAKGRIGRKEG